MTQQRAGGGEPQYKGNQLMTKHKPGVRGGAETRDRETQTHLVNQWTKMREKGRANPVNQRENL